MHMCLMCDTCACACTCTCCACCACTCTCTCLMVRFTHFLLRAIDRDKASLGLLCVLRSADPVTPDTAHRSGDLGPSASRRRRGSGRSPATRERDARAPARRAPPRRPGAERASEGRGGARRGGPAGGRGAGRNERDINQRRGRVESEHSPDTLRMKLLG